MRAKSQTYGSQHRFRPLSHAALRARGPEALFEKLNEQLALLMDQIKPALYARSAEDAVQEALAATDENLRHMRALQDGLQHELSRMNERLSESQELLALLLRSQADPAGRVALARSPTMVESTVHQERVVPGAESPMKATEGWEALIKQGEARRVSWVKEGLVVPTSELAKKWSRTRQALDQAGDRGELFSLKVGKNKFYPAAFLDLDADAVKQVCLALKGDDSTAKFLFWSRKHGALGNKTIAEALKEGRVARAEELALGWSEERGLPNASAA